MTNGSLIGRPKTQSSGSQVTASIANLPIFLLSRSEGLLGLRERLISSELILGIGSGGLFMLLHKTPKITQGLHFSAGSGYISNYLYASESLNVYRCRPVVYSITVVNLVFKIYIGLTLFACGTLGSIARAQVFHPLDILQNKQGNFYLLIHADIASSSLKKMHQLPTIVKFHPNGDVDRKWNKDSAVRHLFEAVENSFETLAFTIEGSEIAVLSLALKNKKFFYDVTTLNIKTEEVKTVRLDLDLPRHAVVDSEHYIASGKGGFFSVTAAVEGDTLRLQVKKLRKDLTKYLSFANTGAIDMTLDIGQGYDAEEWFIASATVDGRGDLVLGGIDRLRKKIISIVIDGNSGRLKGKTELPGEFDGIPQTLHLQKTAQGNYSYVVTSRERDHSEVHVTSSSGYHALIPATLGPKVLQGGGKVPLLMHGGVDGEFATLNLFSENFNTAGKRTLQTFALENPCQILESHFSKIRDISQ